MKWYLYMRGGNIMVEELYRLYSKDVYFYIYHLCKNQSLSEDLTSETFYQVMLSLPSYQGKSSIKSWIFSIARHTTYKELRKRKIEISIDELPEVGYNSDYSLLYDEMKALMEQQSEINQKVFYLRLDGYSYEEIAEQLQMNINSIRVVHHRNKKYLKKHLKRGESDENEL